MGSLKKWSESLSCKTWFLKPIKIRLNPKDEPSILKIVRVMILFCVATWGENLYKTRFLNLKISVSFWDLGPIFCKWAQFLDMSNFHIATWGLTQLLHCFLRGGWFSPSPHIHRIWTLDPSQVGLIHLETYKLFTTYVR